MNEKDMMPISVHEYDMARMERIVKRLWIVILLLVVCLVGSNLAWTIYESQFKDVVITQEGCADENSQNFFNGTGEMNNGDPWTANDQNSGKP